MRYFTLVLLFCTAVKPAQTYAESLHGYVNNSPDTLVRQLGTVTKTSTREVRVNTSEPAGNRKYYSGRSLNQLLSENAAIYFKNYGNGHLSSVSYRGTSAAQNDLLWNGIRLNNPSLGQVDFSLYAVNGMQQVSVSTAAVTGNVGAAIYLHSFSHADSAFNLQGSTTLGSFGTARAEMMMQYGNGKIMGVSSCNYICSQNNYRFINTYKPGRPVERLSNARVNILNVMQQFVYEIRPQHRIGFDIWLTDAQRQIPPVISKPHSRELQRDYSMRTQMRWYGKLRRANLQLVSAWLHDVIDYHNPDIYLRSISTMQAWRNLLSVKYDIGSNLFLQAIGEFDAERAKVPAYGGIKVRYIHRWSAVINYKNNERFHVSFTARQALFNRWFSPFSPLLTLQYHFINHRHYMHWRIIASRNFRYPTLNDWYWTPGGNPALKPEKSWDGQSGIHYTIQDNHEQLKFDLEANGYVRYVNNWILWLSNGNFWEPRNVKSVLARGAETRLKINFDKNNWHYSNTVAYQFTRATNLTSVTPNDQSAGKQLIYTPLHTFSAITHIAYKKYFIRFVVNATGKVFVTTDNSQSLNGFTLLDTEIGKDVNIGRSEMGIAIKLLNITDRQYQSVLQRPMPGRSVEVTLRYNITP
ncbi:MAG: TonB-dependent receptor plug domain-containing protein [Chitinophagales bacterium]|nr:TonB-dependent receptor plug domain-containing protein [Chitinophagales bacterium]MDW8419507.1 TonB-dependent receptor [Chitinophagales bacterium]